MKRPQSFILFPIVAASSAAAADAPRAWRVLSVGRAGRASEVVETAEADAGRDAVATSLASALRRLGRAGHGVTLALPSCWCMSATVDGGPSGFDRRAMLFKLEERVPLAAEEVAADFVPVGEPSDARRHFAVCAQIVGLRGWIESLERAGIAVESVAPAAMMALGSALERAGPGSPAGPRTVLIAEGDLVSVVVTNDRRPVAWDVVPRTPADLAAAARFAAFTFLGSPVFAFGLTTAELADAAADWPVTLVDAEADVVALAASSSAATEGERFARFELRRGPLAVADRHRLVRGPLNLVLAAAAALLLCVAGGLVLRAARYDRRAEDASARAARAFAEAFPAWPAPANVRAVVESEHRKLRRPPVEQPEGTGSPTPRAAGSGSALATLLRLLAAVPAGEGSAPFRVDRLSLGPDRFELEGAAPAAETIDDLVTSCRAAGLTAASPEVRRGADGGWTFVLRGDSTTEARAAREPG